MNDPLHDDPYAVFVPRLGRFILVELWGVVLSIGIGAVLLGLLGSWSWQGLLGAVVAGLVSVLIGGAFLRHPRRLVIGDTWISGPTGTSNESTTIQFGEVDPAKSSIRRRRLLVQSLGGRAIVAKTAWFSHQDLEEIRRLLRDRYSAHGIPVSA